MASHHAYSELQVVQDYSLPEAVRDRDDRHFALSDASQYAYKSPDSGAALLSTEKQQTPQRICGLARKPLWAVAAAGVLLIVIGAIVGGVLGSNQSRASASPATASSQTDTAASSGTLTPTTTGPIVISTTTEISAKKTLYRDCPSANNTVYGASGSSQFQFRKFCGTVFRSDYADMVNKPTSSLNDCIDLCAAYNIQNKTEIQAGKSNVCNTVCWRYSLDSDLPGQCFGSTTTNSSTSGFPITEGRIECDSAGWINQVV